MNERIHQLMAEPGDDGPTSQRVRLRTAAHEIGHALALLAAGFTIDQVRMRVGRTGRLRGECVPEQEAHEDMPPEQLRGWLVAFMAGHAAETRFGQLYAGLAEADAYQWGMQGAAHDYDLFAHYRHQLSLRLSTDRAYHRAAHIVEHYSHRLDALTLRLAHAHQLTGAAL